MFERQVVRREQGEAQIAVLIDYENVGLGSIQALFDQISDVGRIIVKRAYADWAAESKKRDQVLELGVEPIHLFRTTGAGKNASDIRLAIDAIDLLFTSPVDTFVIVSSDSDFVPLTSKLRSAGKTVIGAGRTAYASKTLITACDRYIYLDAPVQASNKEGPTMQKQVETLLVRAVNASMDSQGQARGGKLHQTMIRLDPSFNFRALGFKTFAQFLGASKEVQIFRDAQTDLIVEVAPSTNSKSANGLPESWDLRIDQAWSGYHGELLPGSWAASKAANVLEAAKLSASRFKTLQKLLDASEYLASRWSRDGSTIVRK